MSDKQLTRRQVQIQRRRKIRQLEMQRDQELLKRDKATAALRSIRNNLKTARLS